MCTCLRSAVHHYSAQKTPLENVLGSELTTYLAEQLGLREPNRFEVIGGIWDCCPGGYLPAALELGAFALMAFVLALIIGAIWGSRPKLVIVALGLWLTTICGGTFMDFQSRQRFFSFWHPDKQQEYLASYLNAIPEQILFEAAIFLILPAAITYAVVRFGRAAVSLWR